MSSLQSSQCLHYSQVNVFTTVKSMSSLQSSQCLHYSQVNVFTTVKSMSSLKSSQCLNRSQVNVNESSPKLTNHSNLLILFPQFFCQQLNDLVSQSFSLSSQFLADRFCIYLKWTNHDHGRQAVFENFLFCKMFFNLLFHFYCAVVLTIIFTGKTKHRRGIVWYGMVWYGMVWYSMVWYGMLWYGMVWYGMVWYGMVWYGMLWYGMVWYGMVWYGMVWYGMVWYGMVWYGMVWSGAVWHDMTGMV